MGDTGMADQSMGAAARHCPVLEENTKGASLVSQCTMEITVNAVPSAAASFSPRGRRIGSSKGLRRTGGGRSAEATRASGTGGSRTYRRCRGSHTASSLQIGGRASFPWSRPRRTRPSRTSIGIQRQWEGRKEKEKSAALASARAAGAAGWGGSAGWKPSRSMKARNRGAWRRRKRRRKEASLARRRKAGQAAEARARSSGSGNRRRISVRRLPG
uniref:Uncharacterized protein n=1 Tax=Triticum urartu TaxID=4572 RepID=A0A8R7R6P3_TRIUA